MCPSDSSDDGLPAIPIRGMVVYPGETAQLGVGRPFSLAALARALEHDERLVLVTQRSAGINEPGPGALFDVGVVCQIASEPEQLQGGVSTVAVRGLWRCRIERYITMEPYFRAVVGHLPDDDGPAPEELRGRVGDLASALAQQRAELGEPTTSTAQQGDVAPEYAAAMDLDVGVEQKQALLAETGPAARCRKVLELLERETAVFRTAAHLRAQGKGRLGEQQRREFLEERKAEVERALADIADESQEVDELRERIRRIDMPPEAREQAEKELTRLSSMPRISPEFPVAMDYVEWLASLPWNVVEELSLDLGKAQKVLDEDHYGREEIKQRVLEYLAVGVLKPARQGMLLCFVGPPGVGKTSFGRSIARATGRRFHRIALGGMRDEAEIRGHRRTYVGALPGRFIRALRTVGVSNPILMLDEVDKLGAGLHGDPGAALLEVLDPEQNNSFTDNYLGVPFDLSRIMFICTANTQTTIPASLLDRLEVIQLSGYSIEEKVQIARRHLLPKQLPETGLLAESLTIGDEVIAMMAERYTRESGVRGLERQLAALCRKVAAGIAGGGEAVRAVDEAEARSMLGTPPFVPLRVERAPRPGMCTTLALTDQGAEIVIVEVQKARGGGKLAVTGRAGDVLRETALLAFGFLRSSAEEFGLSAKQIGAWDYHVHFPGTGGPAEGASVGLPIFAAFLSILRESTLPEHTAVLGELTLTGRVLETRDVPEKLVAAKRAGIETVLVPDGNRKDVEPSPRSRLPEGVEVIYCRSAAEAARVLLPHPVGHCGSKP